LKGARLRGGPNGVSEKHGRKLKEVKGKKNKDKTAIVEHEERCA